MSFLYVHTNAMYDLKWSFLSISQIQSTSCLTFPFFDKYLSRVIMFKPEMMLIFYLWPLSLLIFLNQF